VLLLEDVLQFKVPSVSWLLALLWLFWQELSPSVDDRFCWLDIGWCITFKVETDGRHGWHLEG
jgi:hypothetical protein